MPGYDRVVAVELDQHAAIVVLSRSRLDTVTDPGEGQRPRVTPCLRVEAARPPPANPLVQGRPMLVGADLVDGGDLAGLVVAVVMVMVIS